jgi:hypothetical protein
MQDNAGVVSSQVFSLATGALILPQEQDNYLRLFAEATEAHGKSKKAKKLSSQKNNAVNPTKLFSAAEASAGYKKQQVADGRYNMKYDVRLDAKQFADFSHTNDPLGEQRKLMITKLFETLHVDEDASFAPVKSQRQAERLQRQLGEKLRLESSHSDKRLQYEQSVSHSAGVPSFIVPRIQTVEESNDRLTRTLSKFSSKDNVAATHTSHVYYNDMLMLRNPLDEPVAGGGGVLDRESVRAARAEQQSQLQDQFLRTLYAQPKRPVTSASVRLARGSVVLSATEVTELQQKAVKASFFREAPPANKLGRSASSSTIAPKIVVDKPPTPRRKLLGKAQSMHTLTVSVDEKTPPTGPRIKWKQDPKDLPQMQVNTQAATERKDFFRTPPKRSPYGFELSPWA